MGGFKIFRTRPDRPWGPLSLLYNGYRVFCGGKEAGGVALTTHPYLAPRLKEEYSYTSTPPLGLRETYLNILLSMYSSGRCISDCILSLTFRVCSFLFLRLSPLPLPPQIPRYENLFYLLFVRIFGAVFL